VFWDTLGEAVPEWAFSESYGIGSAVRVRFPARRSLSGTGAVSLKFMQEQPQIPFDFAQGRLSTHPPKLKDVSGPVRSG